MTQAYFADVYRHMEWADARIWTAVLASESAMQDDFVCKTLMHLHETQHSFLNAWLENPFVRWKFEDFESMEAICSWGKDFYTPQQAFFQSLSDDDLNRPMILPWAKYMQRALGHPAADTTLWETIHQLASHSMHHRGQIARKIREAGSVPPLNDHIGWVWSSRPPANWPL